jgi:hypothetical protein
MSDQAKTISKEVYTQKTGSAFRINQTIEILGTSQAPYRAIRVPEKDKNIAAKIIENNKLKGYVEIEVI